MMTIHTKRPSISEDIRNEAEVIYFDGTFISIYGFSNCKKLKVVYIGENTEVLFDHCFYNCENLEKVIIRSSKLKVIPQWCFSNCKNLKRIVIPEGVEIIGQHAFDMCSELDRVILPSTLKAIDEWCFYWCKKLFKLFIHDGCEKIGTNAFSDCHRLERIRLPKTLKLIGEHAFSLCSLHKEYIKQQYTHIPNLVCEGMTYAYSNGGRRLVKCNPDKY